MNARTHRPALKQIALAMLLALVLGCRPAGNFSEPNATILIWHDWPEPQSAALEALLRGFEEVHPSVTVVVEYVPVDELRATIFDQAAAGLGPDLIIESNMATVADLYDADLLTDLSQVDIDTSELLSHAVDALRINDGLYGVPFAAHTNILYFNKALLPTQAPPSSIEELRSIWPIDDLRKEVIVEDDATSIQKNVADDEATDVDSSEEVVDTEAGSLEDELSEDMAEPPPAESIETAKERVVAQIGSFVGRNDGRQVALATDFFHAYWGIRAFGGSAFDETGKLKVDEGFTNWLHWLLKIQQEPTVILDNNYADLVDAFAHGRIALMIGDSAEFVELQRRLGVENLGVSTLPRKGDSAAGGLLELEVISMSKLTSQPGVCSQVIRYMCNEINQRKLALSEVGQIPVNRRIRFNGRLMPVAATLKKQIEHTSIISLSNVRNQERMFEIGNAIYLSVLAGELAPEDAIRELEQEFEDATDAPLPN